MTRLIPPLFLILLTFSCRESLLTETEKAAIVEGVRMTLKNYHADIKKSGLTAEFNYLDKSDDFYWVPPGYSSAISYDSVAAILKRNSLLYTSVENTFDTLRITALSKDLAGYTGRLHATMTDTTGKSMSFSLVETGLLIKRKDGWKLLSGQTAVIN